MADIFISYKKEDAGRVVRIVEGLREEGLSVWWDHGIAPGSQWDQTIQRELNAAGMVIACWSELSVSAPWVKEEAGVGKSKGKLLPVRIDDVEPPLGFGLIQMADLIDWDGDKDDPHWEHFIAAVRAVLSGEAVEGLEKPVRRKAWWPVLAIVALGVVALGGVVAFGLGLLDDLLGREATSGPARAPIASTTNPAPQPASEAEKAMFAKAEDSRLKSDFQDYLRSFPQGFYAKRIREEILPICAGETRPVWKPPQMPLGQMFRSGSVTDGPGDVDITYDTKAAACQSAQDAFKASADSYCLAFTTSLESRNREVGYTIQDCVCQEAGGNWWCYTDSTYSCTYEFKTQEYVEVCG